MYTKDGKPLQVSGETVYSQSGAVVGRISGHQVFSPSGRYVGTIVGDRLVYRSTESNALGGAFVASSRVGSARVSSVGSAVWGDEPDIPD